MKKYISLLIFSFVWTKASALTILLDPGHGGSELGAKAFIHQKKKIYEKDLNLKLAKIIQKKLATRHSVFLTRSYDKKVSLAQRAEIADKVNADLIISIHFNSSLEKGSHGFETYYLDNNNDAAVKKVEEVENHDHDGIDNGVNKILIDLAIDKTVSQSKKLSSRIHSRISKNIKKKFRMKDRGVKPGLFYVLALSKRPGVLLEAGFVSNSNEAQKITQPSFLNRYADSVVQGILDYSSENTSIASVPLF